MMEQQIIAGLVQRGMPLHVAQGVAANMKAESRLDPGINEIAPLVPGSRGGFGLNQWTGPRRVAYENFAAERGVPLNDLGAQLDFTMLELQGPESRAWEALQGTTDPIEAARVYSEMFLRPGIPHMDTRLKYAAEIAGLPFDPNAFTASTKGGAPMGLLEVPQEQGGGILSLLTGKQKPWATKLNDIGAVLLALSGSPAAQPLLQMVQDRKEGAREDARINRTAQWLAANGRPDLAEAMLSGALPAADAARIAMEKPAAPDPMAAIELEKAQIELDRLKNPQGEVPKTLTERQALLAAAGLDPASPEGQAYLLTGELPKAPEAGYTRLTPEQVATIPGLDPAKAYQMSPEGKIETIGGGGTTVNVDTGAGGKFEEEFAKLDAQALAKLSEAGTAAQRNLGRIDQLDALLTANPTGAGAAITQFAGSIGIQTEGLSEIEAAQALINSLVPEQRQPGSGPMSDADLALFKQSLPRIINSPGGNKIIVDTMRAIAQYDAQAAEIVQRTRLPEGDPNRLTRAQAFDALQNRPNPLDAIKAGGATPASADNAAPGGPARIANDAEYNALPSGAEFIGPDGKLRRKP